MSLLQILRVPESHVLELGYVILMETHLVYLRNHKNTTVVDVTAQVAEKYIGDLNGLLDTLAIDKKYYYLITRMNGYLSSEEYDGTATTFMVPDFSEASQILAMYTSIED